MTDKTPPKKAFVLAAGFGTRMRPLTDHCPKPLLYVNQITMLDHALDSLESVGVEEVVVNVHYLGDMIVEHLKNRLHPKITISREEEILDTAGGVKKMLSFFGDEPFYVLNADIVFVDGGQTSTLQRLANTWDSSKMDLLLLMESLENQEGFEKGDYYLDGGEGFPVFGKNAQKPANVIFAGPRIVDPKLFEKTPDGKFGFVELFHKAEKNGRLYALRHDGEWHHVGTPDALNKTNTHLANKNKKIAP